MTNNANHWKLNSKKSGVYEYQLESWEFFFNFIRSKMLDFDRYVYRGDRCNNRPLLPSFDRQFNGKTTAFMKKKMEKHLNVFKASVRGRRGPNPVCSKNDEDWWALGQHNGLDTPLLDWTQSPFVALFFAFEKPDGKDQTPNRCIYAASSDTCNKQSAAIAPNKKEIYHPNALNFFRPLQDDNPRLINQNSVFSWGPTNKAVDIWVTEQFPASQNGILLKIFIPNSGREECLRTLNRMNINHLTLFPDLYGASRYTNLMNTIDKY